MKTLFTYVLIATSLSIHSQNMIRDPSFEQDLKPFNDFRSRLSATGYNRSRIDSMSPVWKSLFDCSFRFSRLYPDRDVDKIVQSAANSCWEYKTCIDKIPFQGNAFGFLLTGYGTYDTLDLGKPVLSNGLNGNPDSSFFLGDNPVIFDYLNRPVIVDSLYIISYRLLQGNGIGHDPNDYHFMNNFGVYFSTKALINLNSHPHGRNSFKITNHKVELQDSILDTSIQWRLVRHEFKADSAYQYIHFGQFLDRRRVLVKINRDSILSRRNSFGIFDVYFDFFLDDIRLLPKWQYLDVSNDTNVCSNDSLIL
ncbi:MAG: hypothetical protein ACOVP5_07630, partial [Chitinophagales bacterium]